MQETWAIHGVYPVDGLDAGQQVDRLLGAAARSSRIDVASGEGRGHPLPRAAPRAQVARGGALPGRRWRRTRFDVQDAALGAASRPKGDRVVYQALGHLWIRDLPDGTPRRLTSQDDHFEFYPVLLARRPPDRLHHLGRRQAGHRARGRRPTAARAGCVTDAARPLRRAGASRPTAADRLPQDRAAASSAPPPGRCEPGIYRRAARPAASRVLITEDGEQPHFGADERPRLPAALRADESKRALVSIGLDGKDERDAPDQRRTPPSSRSRPTAAGWPSASASTPT